MAVATIVAAPLFDDPAEPYASGGGEFEVGATVELTAHPTAEKRFSYWSNLAGEQFTENPISVVVPENGDTYTAHFYADEVEPEDWGDPPPTPVLPEYTITLGTEGGIGTVTGGGVYRQGDTCTITAEPLGIYVFCGWFNRNWPNRGNKLLKQSPFSFAVFADETYVAQFDYEGSSYDDWTDDDQSAYEESRKEGRQRVTVETAATGYYGGTVTGGGTFYQGEVCTLTGTPNTSSASDNKFIQWMRVTDLANPFATCQEVRIENPYSFNVYTDQKWVGVFSSGLVKISVSANVRDTANPFPSESAGFEDFPHVAAHLFGDLTNVVENVAGADGNRNWFKVYEGNVPKGVGFSREVSAAACFYNPSGRVAQTTDPKIYYPVYAVERNSGRKVFNPVSAAEWMTGQGTRLHGSFDATLDRHYDHAANEDWYVHYICLSGFILRNANGDILGNGMFVLRGPG